ncbi:MAG TPA: DUF423 domain-containing protein [Gemmatimonadales bacterium]|nr:DUF423 domain-containing protein [Gemmatimonadales bacterium]
MTHRHGEQPGGEFLIAAGALLAGLGVAAGAFGAHYLKGSLNSDQLDIWHTAANYQMYHALALIVAARLLSRHPTRLLRAACGLFLAGILLFSGSLYLLALTDASILGVITPLGGLAFLAAWGCLAVGIVRDTLP